MSEFSTELLFIVFLIAMNNILAMTEAALLAVRKTRLQQRVNEGDIKAGIVLKLVENPNQFLSVIQIGITLIDVLTGAITGATVAIVLARQFENIPVLAPYSDSLGLAVGVLIITYFSIILGELVPKTVGNSKSGKYCLPNCTPNAAIFEIAIACRPFLEFLYKFGTTIDRHPPIQRTADN